LAANAVAARSLSQSDMGAYLLSYSVVFVVAALARMGMQQVVVRFAGHSLGAGDRGAAKAALLGCTVLAAASSAIFAVCLASPVGSGVLGLFSLPTGAYYRSAMALWLFCESTRVVLAEAMRGYNDIRGATSLGDSGRNVLLFLGMSVAAISGLTLDLAIAVSAATGIIIVASLVVFSTAKVRADPRQPVRWGQLLRVALPLTVASVGLLALSQVDVWMVGIFLDREAVSIYATANRVVTLLAVPIFVVNAVTLPYIARARVSSDEVQLRTIIGGASAIACVPMFAGLLVIVLLGDDVLTLVFGSAYGASQTPLILLGLGQMVSVLTGLCGVTLIMFGHERTVMAASLGSATLMVASTILASRTGDLALVALACATAIAVQNSWLLVACRIKVGIWTLADPRPSTLRRMGAAARTTMIKG